jgi:hypothetical protein
MFQYKHLPAKGIGKRDPLRPYVLGGIGKGTIIVYPATLLRMRVVSRQGYDAPFSIVEGKPI